MYKAVALPFVLETWQNVLIIALCFVLMLKRGFWFVAFTIGSLAAGVELLASITHSHITSTVGYGLFMLVCWSVATAIAGGYPQPWEKVPQVVNPPSTGGDNPDWSPH